jgi:hypothetical protein
MSHTHIHTNTYIIICGQQALQKRPLKRPQNKWEVNIKKEPREIGYQDAQWIQPDWGPMAGCCEYEAKFSGSIKGAEFLDQINDYYVLKDHSYLWG